jgi:hypothetical protein
MYLEHKGLFAQGSICRAYLSGTYPKVNNESSEKFHFQGGLPFGQDTFCTTNKKGLENIRFTRLDLK